MSLIFSIIRIVSPSRNLRLVTYGIAFVFFLVWAILIALKLWFGQIDRKWHKDHGPTGQPAWFMPTSLTIIELTSTLSIYFLPFT